MANSEIGIWEETKAIGNTVNSTQNISQKLIIILLASALERTKGTYEL